MSSCQCYKVGGPFIAEDPDCPRHGREAQREEELQMEERAQQEQELDALMMRVATLEEHNSLLEKALNECLRRVVQLEKKAKP